ncbi:hypothetical protein GGF44_002769 [Coemansia sp. RSA 1694]|nr:hypothetical protein GGF44_002769 [Coemansia sp. RSA 1694]
MCSDYSDDDEEDAEGSDEDVDWDANGIIAALMKAVGADGIDDADDSNNARQTNGVSNNENTGNLNASEDATLAAAMHAMDKELSATHIGKSFTLAQRGHSADDLAAETDEAPDVNIDLNLVENIVESFRAQEGLPGPAGTLLGQFGIHLPHIDSDSDSESTP